MGLIHILLSKLPLPGSLGPNNRSYPTKEEIQSSEQAQEQRFLTDEPQRAPVMVARGRSIEDTRCAPKGLRAPTAHADGLPFDELGQTLDAMALDVDLRVAEGTIVGEITYDPDRGMAYTVFEEYAVGSQHQRQPTPDPEQTADPDPKPATPGSGSGSGDGDGNTGPDPDGDPDR